MSGHQEKNSSPIAPSPDQGAKEMFTDEDLEELRNFKRKGKKAMSFIQIGEQLNDYTEERPVATGEYLLRVTGARILESSGSLLVRMEVVEDPYAKEITDFFNLPGHGRTPKEENRNRGKILKFFSSFDIDPSGQYKVDEQAPEGFVGREGYGILSDPTDDGKGYGPQNKVSRYSPRQ